MRSLLYKNLIRILFLLTHTVLEPEMLEQTRPLQCSAVHVSVHRRILSTSILSTFPTWGYLRACWRASKRWFPTDYDCDLTMNFSRRVWNIMKYCIILRNMTVEFALFTEKSSAAQIRFITAMQEMERYC